jgi:CheY-like chemotaxis protein
VPFAAVITDLGMPYVDGRKVATAIKAAAPQTPVIMLTGWGRRLLAEKDLPANVDRVLSKPPKLAELRAALAELTALAAAGLQSSSSARALS